MTVHHRPQVVGLRTAARAGTIDGRRVISPIVQKTDLGAPGGLGDFASQAGDAFPGIDWAMPLTPPIARHLGEGLPAPFVSLPVTLFDPVTDEPHVFAIDVHAHVSARGVRTFLFHNAALMDPPALRHRILADEEARIEDAPARARRLERVRIAWNGYGGGVCPLAHRTLANTPGLAAVHPLMRRYIEDGAMLDAVVLGALCKAIVALMAWVEQPYDVVWVHDWHFAAIAGEMLLPARAGLAARTRYVQHLHNALHQGILTRPDLARILGWPAGHLSNRCFRVHGQLNLLGGALNCLRHGALAGDAVAVSDTHAGELATLERGAGLDHVMAPLRRAGRLKGLFNPLRPPADLEIRSAEDIATRKPVLKAEVQNRFGLPVRPEACLVLWSHRFTHQKQAAAVLAAVEALLEAGEEDLQVLFFCDIHHGSDPSDVARLEGLIDRFPGNVATGPFDRAIEMRVAGGADAALMASYFEPFGYAPVWVGLQGGFVVTGDNGGQRDIFEPSSTFFMDIRPDIDKPARPTAARWRAIGEYLVLSRAAWRERIFRHNARAVADGLSAALAAYRDADRRDALARATMAGIRARIAEDAFGASLGAVLAGRARVPAVPGTPRPRPATGRLPGGFRAERRLAS